MKGFSLSLLAVLVLLTVARASKPEMEDNDFAEFEEFDEEEVERVPKEGGPEPSPDGPRVVMSPDAILETEATEEEEATVEDDEDEFGNFDEDEFEGYDRERPVRGKGAEKPPDLKITKVPIHLRANWDSFYMEMLMVGGLGVYLLNFLAGKTKNNKLAQTWLMVHKKVLESNFCVVGDDGQDREMEEGGGVLMKDTENTYSLWCSGRDCCQGMLVTLKLVKRQDLISTISRMFKPVSDQVNIQVTMDDKEMDNFVFCVADKKVCSKLQKDMNDLSLFCPDRKSVEKTGLPSSFQLLSEIGEATGAILDRMMVGMLSKHEAMVEYIHVSDQYSGPKQQDDSQPSSMPETQKVLNFCFNVPGRGQSQPKDVEAMRPLMDLVMHVMDKVKRLRLGKEARSRSDKNRQKVEESYLRATHAQRQEAAQQRREDKKRAEKERIMNEEDPDKQKKLEERNERREAKKKQPKSKMMKVKAM